jgi:glycosyltransferase involved in cell wall biosynthesis
MTSVRETPREFFVVDDGSTDEPPDILRTDDTKKRLPLHFLQEPTPGKSRALNTALTKVSGELIIFSDDDMEPVKGWLKAYHTAEKEHKETFGFTGKIIPSWEVEPPSWFHLKGKFALPQGLTNIRDFGKKSYILPSNIVPGCGNTALRRSILEKTGQFRIDLGPGTKFPFAEDTEFMRRLLILGENFCYLPEAIMYHHNPKERVTKKYVMNWVFRAAVCQIFAFKALPSENAIFGIPIYLLRQVITRFFRWALEHKTPERFIYKLRLIHTLGEIKGYLLRVCTL